MSRWTHAWLVGWLTASIGLHLAILQTVAWSLMFAGFIRSGDAVQVAVGKTFDGQHPCRLCAWVRSKAADSTNDAAPSHAQPNLPKLELAGPSDAITWTSPLLTPARAASVLAFAPSRSLAPPVPPPRGPRPCVG
ncbi:MAG: hypothetical protein WCR07_06570 [Verrucomicrobiota bacterium]